MKHRVSEELRQESLDRLREQLPPGSTVYTVLRHVSRSGMCRWIDLFAFDKEGVKFYVSGYAWNVGVGDGAHPNDQRSGGGGLRIGGCGMDMGFALVYELSRILYPDGFDCIGERCPAADHVNRVTPPPGTCRDHAGHRDGVCRGNCKPWHHGPAQGSYALRQEWL